MRLDFRDTIIVRRTGQKGTKVVREQLDGLTFYEKLFDDGEKNGKTCTRLDMIMGVKSNKKIYLNELDRTKSTCLKELVLPLQKELVQENSIKILFLFYIKTS